MFEVLPLGLLVPNPMSPNRLSRAFVKKLRHSIDATGKYEALTVRPHPERAGRFEILNGHGRLAVLRELGVEAATCDVWQVTDQQAKHLLGALNRLRGTDVPELRMRLLLSLLEDEQPEELAAHLPEGAAYLSRLKQLPDEIEQRRESVPVQEPDTVIMDFYLTRHQHEIVAQSLLHLVRHFRLADSSEALVRAVEICLEHVRDT